MKLSPEAFARAATFMGQARPLERTLFDFRFDAAPASRVLAELQKHQNVDGGFHSLEADIGFAVSTVLSTCHALHLLHELHAPGDHPAVQRALDYLSGTYDRTQKAWPIIPPHDNSQPHAPWWHYEAKTFAENWGRFQDNPRPDVLAGLFFFTCEKTASLRSAAERSVLQRLRTAPAEMDMHGLICYLRLHAVPGLPGELKQALEQRLPAWIESHVEHDPEKWAGYRLRPLDVAPTADSPWRAGLEAAIEANLDYLIRTQTADGSWHPHWNWGDAFPEAWPAAKLKWQANLTLQMLRSLHSYGRIAR